MNANLQTKRTSGAHSDDGAVMSKAICPNDRRQGYLLALELMNDAYDDSEACGLETGPKRNIMLQYIESMADQNPAVMQGFCALMSDFISIVVAGSIPDVPYYEGLLGFRVEEAESAS